MGDCTVSAEDCTNGSLNCSIVADSLPEIAESCDFVALGRPATGPGPFRWTKAAERAAVLVSEGAISNGAIAFECKVAIRTVSYWKSKPEFQARVEQLRKITAGDAMDFSIARKIERVRALDARWTKMHQVIEARGSEPEMAKVPGGPSGLLVREIKGIGAGENFREVEEYKVDTGLLKELREHEKQAAIEVGQWQESGQQLKPGEQRLTVTYDAIQQIQQADPERWRRIEQAAAGIVAEERAAAPGRLVVDEGAK